MKQRRAERRGLVVPIAFAAAIGQAVGQAWDVRGHLALGNGGPVAWTLIALGPVAAAAVILVDWRHERVRSLRENNVRP